MKVPATLVGFSLALALIVVSPTEAATLYWLNHPAITGDPLATASLEDGPPFNTQFSILCIDGSHPGGGTWPTDVLTIEEAAANNARGFDLETLKLIVIASLGMFDSKTYNVPQQVIVWQIGNLDLTPAEAALLGVDISLLATFDFSRVTIYNPSQVPALNQVAMSIAAADGGEIPEPTTYAMMSLGVAALGLLGRRWKRPL